MINRCFLFCNLDMDSARELYSSFEELSFRIGDDIFKSGDIGDSLYVINEGAVKITIPDRDGALQVVATLSEGDVIGEMALITGKARTGNATFITNGRLLKLDKEKFDSLKAASIKLHSGLVANIARIVSYRLAAMTEKVSALIDGLHSVEESQIDLEAQLAKGRIGLMEFLGLSRGKAPGKTFSQKQMETVPDHVRPDSFGIRGGK